MNEMKHKIIYIFATIILGAVMLASCGGSGNNAANPVVPIYCDEDFKPFMSSEVDVFGTLNYPKGITPFYSDEVTAFDMLMKDSVRLIVASRKLKESEKILLKETKNLKAREVLIAYDGIAVIVNKNNPDSLITVDNLRKVFLGEITEWKQLNPGSKLGKIQTVFNHPSSGTVQYAKDSICNGQNLSSELKALNSNQEVLEHVTSTPNALGIIGVSWISNDLDSLQLSFFEKISVMSISTADVATEYNATRPYQYYLAMKDYPFIRNVYVIYTDPINETETTFAYFLAGERGQLIIKKAGLLPAGQNTRLVVIKDNLD